MTTLSKHRKSAIVRGGSVAVSENSYQKSASRAQRQAEPERKPLGNSATSFQISDKRRERYKMRSVLWDVSGLNSVRKCGRIPIGRAVKLRHTEGRRAGYGGLATCGSWSACPVCSAKIARVRKSEVQSVIDSALLDGCHVSMLTLTQRHHSGQKLDLLWQAMSKAWNAVTGGQKWLDFKEKLGVVGYIRAAEVTHGKNGWHVHSHVLVISRKDPTTTPIFHQRKQGNKKTPYPVTVEMPADFIAGRWGKKLKQLGIDFVKNSGGLDWQTAKDAKAIGNYVAKIGGEAAGNKISSEITLGGFKKAKRGNRTPFQILADFMATGDMDSLDLWHIWEKAAKGRRSITFSKGLREWAELGKEKTDEEIAEEENGGEVIAEIPNNQWSKIMKIGENAPLELIEVTERGGKSAAYDWLDEHGIFYLEPEPESAGELCPVQGVLI